MNKLTLNEPAIKGIFRLGPISISYNTIFNSYTKAEVLMQHIEYQFLYFNADEY